MASSLFRLNYRRVLKNKMIFKKVTKVRESGGGAMASHTEFLREKALKNKRLCLSQEEGKNISNRDERQRR